MRRTLLALAVLAPLLAHAAVSKDVQKYLNAAATMIENLDYEKALKQIDRAKGKSQGAEDDAQIAFYEGVVFSELGKTDKALTAFKTGLSMSPDAKLPIEVSPKVEKNFEEARANVKKMLAPQLQREEEERKRAEAERLEAERKKKEEEDARERERLAALQLQNANANASNAANPGVTQSTGGGARKYAWVPAAGGAVFAGAGAYFLLGAKGRYDALVSGTATGDPAAVRDEGKSMQTTGLALVGVGVVALGAAGALYAMGGEGTQVSALATPSGAYLGVRGTFP